MRDEEFTRLQRTGALLLGAVLTSAISAQEIAPAAIRASTFLGGVEEDFAFGIAVEASGDVVVSGFTGSESFSDAGDEEFGGGRYDAFIARLSPNLRTRRSFRFVGGSDEDRALNLVLLPDGAAVVIGQTRSRDFPTTDDALQSEHGGGWDAFLVVLEPTFDRIRFATLLGGEGDEALTAAKIDGSGCLVAVGSSSSDDFSEWPGFSAPAGGFQQTNGGGHDVLVLRVDLADDLAPEERIDYCSFLGGSGDEVANDQWDRFIEIRPSDRMTSPVLAIDEDDTIIVAGGSTSLDFPVTAGALQAGLALSPDGNLKRDAFVSRLRLDAELESDEQLLYSTYLGGDNSEQVEGVGFDPSGDVLIAGWTYSSFFPTTADTAIQSEHAGVVDVFFSRLRLDPELDEDQLVYSTLLGGSLWDFTGDLLVHSSGAVTISGTAISGEFPSTIHSWYPSGFMARMTPFDDASPVSYELDYAGSGGERNQRLAIDRTGVIYVAGYTSTPSLRGTDSAAQSDHAGSFDALVHRLEFSEPPPAVVSREFDGLRDPVDHCGDFAPGDVISVRLTVSPAAGSASLIVVDTPPEDWEITEISHHGVVEDGRVRWQLDTIEGEVELSYQVTTEAVDTRAVAWGHGEVREVTTDSRPFSIGGSSRLTLDSAFDDCGGIACWNLLGPFEAPEGATRSPTTMLRDFLTDGVTSEIGFAFEPGASIHTDFGGASAALGISSEPDERNPGGVPTVFAWNDDDGFVELDPGAFGGDVDGAMGYAQTYVTAEATIDEVFLGVSSDDAIAVLVNDVVVHVNAIERAGSTACRPQDREIGPFRLREGENTILVKVFEKVGGWNFAVRFEDSLGNPVTEGLTVSKFPSTCRRSPLEVERSIESDEMVSIETRPRPSWNPGDSSHRVSLDLRKIRASTPPCSTPETVHVRETIPEGWAAEEISHDGSFDGVEIFWELDASEDELPNRLTYQAVPDSECRDVTFVGEVTERDSDRAFVIGGERPSRMPLRTRLGRLRQLLVVAWPAGSM